MGPWPSPCITLAARVTAMSSASSHSARADTRTFRRADWSMTIELE